MNNTTTKRYFPKRLQAPIPIGIKKYLDIISKTESLSKETEVSYIKKAKRGDLNSKNLLFEAHLKLVIDIALSYSNHPETLEDLIQEGTRGLDEALKRFKLEKNVRFNTYAREWIRAYIIKYFNDNVRSFTIPGDIAVKLHRINNTIEKISKKTGGEVTDEEIARELKYEKGYIHFLRKYLIPHRTLDFKIGRNRDDGTDQKTLLDTIPDNQRDDASESLIRVDAISKIKEAVSELSKKERFVIECRYGLEDKDEQTLKDVGRHLGLTEERIRQIQVIAETKLKKKINR